MSSGKSLPPTSPEPNLSREINGVLKELKEGKLTVEQAARKLLELAGRGQTGSQVLREYKEGGKK